MATSNALTPITGPRNNARSNWAAPQDWEKHREVISELYGRMTLPKVMELMEREHGFKASVKMYKARITRWRLDKNSKESEMKAMVRKHKQRQELGKNSFFLVRERIFTYEDVVRYWERKRMTIDDVIAQRSSSKTPGAVRCVTPVPSPITPPRVFAIPERILACTTAYYKGSLESGAWVKDKDATGQDMIVNHYRGVTADLNSLVDHLQLACDLFDNNEFEEAGQALITATSDLQKILIANDYRTVGSVYGNVLQMHEEERPEIGLAIIKQLHALGKIKLGTNHPLSQIYGLLASTEQSQLENLVAAALESITDVFESEVGSWSSTTLHARLEYIQICVLHQDPEQAISILKSLLQQCETRYDSHDPLTNYIRETLGDSFFVGQDYENALQIYQYIIEHDPFGNDQYSLCNCLWYSGFCWIELHEIDRGEENLRRAIAVGLSRYGPRDPMMRRWLIVLEKYLSEGGRLEDAAQVREQRR